MLPLPMQSLAGKGAANTNQDDAVTNNIVAFIQ